jgi:hypothetical protein
VSVSVKQGGIDNLRSFLHSIDLHTHKIALGELTINIGHIVSARIIEGECFAVNLHASNCGTVARCFKYDLLAVYGRSGSLYSVFLDN